MTWIACDVDLPADPKTLDLGDAMGWDQYETTGRLLKFWGWCLAFADSGDLRPYAPSRIAQGIGLPSEQGERVMQALISSGWVDKSPYLRIHDWWNMVGGFLKWRHKSEPELWKRVETLYSDSETTKTEKRSRAAPEQVYATLHNKTKHNSTEQNKTKHHHHHQQRLQSADDGVGDGGVEDGQNNARMLRLEGLKREINHCAGDRRYSANDDKQLLRLLERHGDRVFESCRYLHGGVDNVIGYLRSILE